MNIQENNYQVEVQKLEVRKKYCTNQGTNDLYPTAPPSKEYFSTHLDHLEFFQRKIIIILKRNELSESLIEILSVFLF